MEDRVKAFLESGKLEAYVYGMLNSKETEEVMTFIEAYPKVKEEYEVLQNQLEAVSYQQAIKAPAGLKETILEQLPMDQPALYPNHSPWPKYLAMLGLLTAILFAWAWKTSNDTLKKERSNYASLAKDCESRQIQLEEQAKLIAILNSDGTKRIDLIGNEKAPEYKAMVFINDKERKAFISPLNEMNLPANKCLQLWGDLDGKMIPVAVLNKTDREDYIVDIDPAFTSLNVTIEEKTKDGRGQDHPDVTNLIASTAI